MKYSAFADWFDEQESFGFRSERAFNALVENKPSYDDIITWLKAAFEAGRENVSDSTDHPDGRHSTQDS